MQYFIFKTWSTSFIHPSEVATTHHYWIDDLWLFISASDFQFLAFNFWLAFSSCPRSRKQPLIFRFSSVIGDLHPREILNWPQNSNEDLVLSTIVENKLLITFGFLFPEKNEMKEANWIWNSFVVPFVICYQFLGTVFRSALVGFSIFNFLERRIF